MYSQPTTWVVSVSSIVSSKGANQMRFISHLHGRTAMLWVLLGALILSACGVQSQEVPMFRANLARTGVFPSDGPTTLNDLVWKFKTDGEFVSSPAIVGGVVYVGSQDGRLYALDARTGQEKWTFKTDGAVYSSPASAGGLVYVGSGDGRLYALDARTGQEKWTFKTDGEFVSSPAVAGGMVYIGSWDGRLYALDAGTGQEKWRFKTDGKRISPPAIAGGVVYFGSSDGYLYAVR